MKVQRDFWSYILGQMWYEEEVTLSTVTLWPLCREAALLPPSFSPFPLPAASMAVVSWVLHSAKNLGGHDADSMRLRTWAQVICFLI